MTAALKRLLLMSASSGIIFNYMGIFINLFIWEKGNSIFDVAWFNLIMFLAWGIAFMYGANLGFLLFICTQMFWGEVSALIRTTVLRKGTTFRNFGVECGNTSIQSGSSMFLSFCDTSHATSRFHTPLLRSKHSFLCVDSNLCN